MHKISVGILIATLHALHPAFGCDYRLLESEAQSYNHRIWSSANIDINILKSSLSFLEDEKEVDPKYSNIDGFIGFSASVKAQSKNKIFINFIDKCEEVYTTTDDPVDKAAVYMLAEEVWGKFIKDLKVLEKTTKFRQNRSSE